MRVIIYGAGAIGCAIGGYLASAGHSVILLGRPSQVKAIQEGGLRLVTPNGVYVLHIPSFINPTQIDFLADDVVFLCVKGQNTEEALCDLAAVNKDVPVFCFQNGVRNEEIAAQYFERTYGVMVRVGAMYITDGEVSVRYDPPGWLVIGGYPKGTDDLVETIATNLRTAGFLVKVTDDVMPYKWGKLIVNLGNAIGTITDSIGDDIRPIGRAARQEATEILSEMGVRWVSTRQLAQDWPEITAPVRGELATGGQNSTWQSLTRGQGIVETDFLNGEIVRQANQLGRDAPINEKLLLILKEIAANHEPPGKYTPAQLCTLLGLDH